ncbi:MAG: reverse transcriptase domain-containing protein [Bacteroidota bacterium]|nr:reverse transcriptase domain-containing protein [Bacteroidota bacterium]
MDIETTGFPKDWDAPVEDFDNWPGILEIAWQLYNDRKNLVNEKSFLISPVGYEISDKIKNLTGISMEVASEDGVSILTVLQEFTAVLLKFNPVVVAHNCEFDTSVIQAHLINNSYSVQLEKFAQICTMKESTSYCDLPNQKYPKLSELYEILFETPPNISHRALEDVKTTSRSFFKLIDLGIIQIDQCRTIILSDIENPTSKEIKKAVTSYISDLNRYPIFYDINEIRSISDDSVMDQIQNNFNKFYQSEKAKAFEIPYNQVINRIVTALKTKDVLIRYILVNYLKNKTNFITSTEKFDEHTVVKLSESHFNKGDRIVVKIDINNCYESIEHNKLITEICNDLNLNEASLFVSVLYNSLKVVFEDINGNVKRKDKGLLIGSKPDEYLAEYFLEKIADKIEENGISLIRVADEFIYFSNSFNSARKKFKTIREIIESYNLEINNSKTIITDHRENVLQNQMDFRLVMAGATDPYLVFRLSDIDSTVSNISKDNSASNVQTKFSNAIESYDSALSFLKELLLSQISVEKYQNKHPKYKYLYNIVFSQPTDFRNDFFITDISIFSKENVEKLKKVILYYPKSEYYTAMAIQLLSFLAKNSIHVTDRMDIDNSQLEGIHLNMHETCIASNLTIIDLLRSNDLHEYQKYILLRCLFKKKNDISLDLAEYEVKEVHYNFFDDIGLANKIPFKGKILEEVKGIYSKTTYYPLKMICSEINNMMN